MSLTISISGPSGSISTSVPDSSDFAELVNRVQALENGRNSDTENLAGTIPGNTLVSPPSDTAIVSAETSAEVPPAPEPTQDASGISNVGSPQGAGGVAQ